MIKRIILMISIVLGVGLVYAQQPPSHVLVEPLMIKEVQDRQKVVGTLRAVARADLAVREEGAVKSVSFNEGDAVKQGDVLVMFDDRRLVFQLAEAQASLSTAQSVIQQREAEVYRASKDYDMKEKAYQSDAISKSEFLDAKQIKDVSSAQLQAAKDAHAEILARIDLINIRIEDMQTKAPFDGVIISRDVEPGEWLQPGSVVASLISHDSIEAWLTIPERFIDVVEKHTGYIRIWMDALNKDVESGLVMIVPDINPQTRTFSLVVTLDNQDGSLKPGMSVSAWVPTGKARRHMLVSQDAVLRSELGSYVFVARPQEQGHMAQNIGVQELFKSKDHVVIQAQGLQEGNLIIVEGNQRLMPMSPVVVGEKE